MIRNILKATTRIAIRIVFETIHRLVINIFDTVLGFLNWPEKKLRVKILILATNEEQSVVSPGQLDEAIEYAKQVFRKNFNVKLLPAGSNEPIVEVFKQNPPNEVLTTKGGTGALAEEFKAAGSFFASNLGGVFYPVTAFVVKDIKGASGCSLGPVSDYITLDISGVQASSVFAHELAHACGLWHIRQSSNLLWPYKNRGDRTVWWQKNIFRSSRHITYW